MLSPERSLPPGKEGAHKTYTADFDSAKYANLKSFKDSMSAEEYEENKAMLDGETIFNQKTWLGERFNAGMSTRQDRIIEGTLFSAFSDEPLLAIYERGRDYRYGRSSAHDRLREAAEIEGFMQIQDTLAAADTPVGTMMLSISPSGGEDSDYTHNFYDVFTLREENGARFVESSRFSSALNFGEYLDATSVLNPNYQVGTEVNDLPLDVQFLANPLTITPESGISSPERLHELLHKEHRTLSREGLEYIFKGCDALFLSYVTLLEHTPWDTYERNIILNTILNKADHLEAEFHRKDAVWGDTYTTIYQRGKTTTVEEDIARFANQEVRSVMTGCGFSGGFDVAAPSAPTYSLGRYDGPIGAFSVRDYGETDRHGERSFYCSNEHLNIRPYNTLIEKCQSRNCKAVVAC